MALFSVYAVTPDVYNKNCYEPPALCNVHVRQLQKVFLSEGIVRNLRNGEWKNSFSDPMICWHPKVKDLLKSLDSAGRLELSAPALCHTPKNDRDWCEEALASHENLPLNGIIASSDTKSTHRRNSLVESVERLDASTKCSWWSPFDCSIRLKRNIDHYKEALKLILRHAKSIKFIDPYIDPNESRYDSLIQLFEAVGERSPKPSVEIHCKIRRGSGQKAPAWDKEEMKTIFQEKFKPVLKFFEKIEILVWDDFHDRYLISNLGGILMSNGFDTSTDSSQVTWARLKRADRDSVQREFHREVNPNRLQFFFQIQ